MLQWTRRTCLVMVLFLASTTAWCQETDIDFNKARELRQRVKLGEKLSKEEQEYLERAQREFRKRRNRPQAPVQLPEGLKPLTDLTDKDRYQGQDGGLYGGGKNEPPQDHRKAALEQAKLIQPLDSDGKPAEEGKIGMISVGMSNTTREFSAFVRLANNDPAKSSHVVIINGAQGGMDAKDWSEPGERFRNERPDPWTVLERRLKQANVSLQQVQVAWIKQARRNPGSIGEFPKHTQEMQRHMVAILHNLKKRFPNLRIVYLSSRIYAGYAKSGLNPEPYAYESAFVVRNLIQKQIEGDPSLNFDASKGEVRSALLLWGPYLWANGEKGRKIDDLVWKPEDFARDGTHPSESGRRKVAESLLRFMTTDPTAKIWFLRRGIRE